MSKLITIFGAGQSLGERLTVPVARTYPIAEVPAALADFTGGAPRQDRHHDHLSTPTNC